MVLSMMKFKFICTFMHRIAMKMYNLACIELNMEIKVLNLTCKHVFVEFHGNEH